MVVLRFETEPRAVLPPRHVCALGRQGQRACACRSERPDPALTARARLQPHSPPRPLLLSPAPCRERRSAAHCPAARSLLAAEDLEPGLQDVRGPSGTPEDESSAPQASR